MNILKLWLRAVRPFAYPASLIPAIFGTALAYSDDFAFKPVLFALTLVGVLFTHTGANLLSDYFDFRSNLDTEQKMGGSRVLVEGLLTPRAFVVVALIFFALAGICALLIYNYVGIKILPLVFMGALVGFFYSFPKYGFKYLAVGEVMVFFAFGVGIGTGAYLVQSDVLSLRAAIVSMPLGLLVAAILFANNVRDLEEDANVSLATLAHVLGRRGSLIFYFVLVFLPYFLIGTFAALGVVKVWTLICIASFPLALIVAGKMWENFSSRSDISSLDAETARLCLVFGILLTGGLVVGPRPA